MNRAVTRAVECMNMLGTNVLVQNFSLSLSVEYRNLVKHNLETVSEYSRLRCITSAINQLSNSMEQSS